MTLVEVIVAMAVLSLIVLLLGASLRGMAQSAQRIEARVDAIDEMRVTVAFLRELFARLPESRLAGPGRSAPFLATPQEVVWVAVMPARYGAAGRYHFRLALEPVPDGTTALVVRYAPWLNDGTAPDWARASSRVLVRQVERMQMHYGGEGMTSSWLAGWKDDKRPPPRLRLDLATTSQTWPPVVLPVRVQATGRASGGFVVGGGSP